MEYWYPVPCEAKHVARQAERLWVRRHGLADWEADGRGVRRVAELLAVTFHPGS